MGWNFLNRRTSQFKLRWKLPRMSDNYYPPQLDYKKQRYCSLEPQEVFPRHCKLGELCRLDAVPRPDIYRNLCC